MNYTSEKSANFSPIVIKLEKYVWTRLKIHNKWDIIFHPKGCESGQFLKFPLENWLSPLAVTKLSNEYQARVSYYAHYLCIQLGSKVGELLSVFRLWIFAQATMMKLCVLICSFPAIGTELRVRWDLIGNEFYRDRF